MTEFVDIEIGADIGQIRLYTTDEDYETYGSEDILNLINNLSKENGQLKNKIKSLTIELSTHKHPLWSTREAERKVNELTELLMNETKKNAVLLEEINSLRIENMRLKKCRNISVILE